MHTEKDLRRFGIKRKVFIPIGFLLFTLILSAVVMLLWNMLLPNIFSIASISYWQAIGILFLSKILFGGFPTGHLHSDFHNRSKEIKERWKQLTPEEREDLRNKWWNRFEHDKRHE
jgi:Ca2+/H+ antiporter, TMEM165/GDT1 family